ncbi:LPS export ABC transporter permease LptG [Comamonas sp. NLF-1-9]|uniref:LPS export ABC transporter permease LptG n=1 Tax=Comamonas sp. NLF-1-9 TaxID=2853163 RepID=UPI001C479550|nr:LPS export ABC transporter permease LptG [Comamonas sp. NLF-1-9]QXL84647.1 LPS export ABC transporter permease LptG [Comamonas sp. NLF-1-9]
MKTLRRYLFREIALSVGFVTLAFIALFFFFDMVDELRVAGSVGPGYSLSSALVYVLLRQPQHVYELLPITVLIGTIFVMARLAQNSEFTIMRTSGLGPWRALGAAALLGMVFALGTFAIGDYVAPASERAADIVRARQFGPLSTGLTGAWLKEQQGERSYAVNVRALEPGGGMRGVRIFAFNADGHLAMSVRADEARFTEDGWQLTQVARNTFLHTGTDAARVLRESDAQWLWPTRITSSMVAASLLNPQKMATLDLFLYVRHLQANGQTAQRYEIELWHKVFYPLSCLVMVVLSLPFAYLHFRSGGMAAYVFGGVMAGISFFLLNNVFGFAGNLQNWSPWLSAAAPGLIYSVLSLGAFGWLVLRQ